MIPRLPFKGSIKGDIDRYRLKDIDVDMDVDSGIAVSTNWVSLKGLGLL